MTKALLIFVKGLHIRVSTTKAFIPAKMVHIVENSKYEDLKIILNK